MYLDSLPIHEPIDEADYQAALREIPPTPDWWPFDHMFYMRIMVRKYLGKKHLLAHWGKNPLTTSAFLWTIIRYRSWQKVWIIEQHLRAVTVLLQALNVGASILEWLIYISPLITLVAILIMVPAALNMKILFVLLTLLAGSIGILFGRNHKR